MSYSNTQSESQTNHARRVSRRIKTDLQLLKVFYDCVTDSRGTDLIHDLELALDNSALVRFTFYLKRNDIVEAAYEYEVNEEGEIETNDRGGRINYDPDLKGVKLSTQVTWNRENWNKLEQEGCFNLSWTTANSPSTGHLISKEDGSYSSGNLGVRRKSLVRH